MLERVKFLHERFEGDVMIEEYIEGRELYVSVMGNKRLTVLPARELFFEKLPDDAPKFATSKAKWDDAYRKKWGIKNGPAAELDPKVSTKLEQAARTTYRVLKIRGLGRIDVRLTPASEVIVIEANPESVAGARGRLRAVGGDGGRRTTTRSSRRSWTWRRSDARAPGSVFGVAAARRISVRARRRRRRRRR